MRTYLFRENWDKCVILNLSNMTETRVVAENLVISSDK